jgi:hypothetical protein
LSILAFGGAPAISLFEKNVVPQIEGAVSTIATTATGFANTALNTVGVSLPGAPESSGNIKSWPYKLAALILFGGTALAVAQVVNGK